MAPKGGNNNDCVVSTTTTSSSVSTATATETQTATKMDPFISSVGSPRPTLREEAAARASSGGLGGEAEPTPASATSSSSSFHGHESFPFHSPLPQTPKHFKNHPLAFSTPVAPATNLNNYNKNTTTESTPEELAHSARKEWRNHGSGITQSLEEKRRLDEDRPGTISVRLISAETRYDVANKKYTAYIMRAKLANGQILQIEHRYSEFAKLNEQFKSHNIQLKDVVFPSKHWAGRMGNWTPSLSWAPEKHDQLVLYRKIQLDVWLVHVVELYNLGDLPHSLAKSVYEFLTLPDRPPCEQENAMATTNNASHQSSSMAENWTKFNNPLSFTLGSTIRQATSTLEHMCRLGDGHDHSHVNNSDKHYGSSKPFINDLNNTDQSIPLDLLQCAKGLCFLTVIKAGLVVSGRIGTGLIICKLDADDYGNNDDGGKYKQRQRWSAPCALGTVGMGWGMLAGGDITHYLVVLTTHDACESLLAGTVQLGAELGVAVGPTGRSANSHVAASNHSWQVHPAYSYAHSQGLFVGMSLEGSILTTRNDVNAKFYGRANITPQEILNLPPPKAAEPLYQTLACALNTTIPENSLFRPSQLFQQQQNHQDYDASTRTSTPTAIPPASGVVLHTNNGGNNNGHQNDEAPIKIDGSGRIIITESSSDIGAAATTCNSPAYRSSPASSWGM